MTDMMLTGRVYDAEEGQRVGLVAVPRAPTAQGLAKAFELARSASPRNAPLSNFAVMHALPRIADMSQTDGLFVESLMAAIAQGDRRGQGARPRLPRRQARRKVQKS